MDKMAQLREYLGGITEICCDSLGVMDPGPALLPAMFEMDGKPSVSIDYQHVSQHQNSRDYHENDVIERDVLFTVQDDGTFTLQPRQCLATNLHDGVYCPKHENIGDPEVKTWDDLYAEMLNAEDKQESTLGKILAYGKLNPNVTRASLLLAFLDYQETKSESDQCWMQRQWFGWQDPATWGYQAACSGETYVEISSDNEPVVYLEFRNAQYNGRHDEDNEGALEVTPELIRWIRMMEKVETQLENAGINIDGLVKAYDKEHDDE